MMYKGGRLLLANDDFGKGLARYVIWLVRRASKQIANPSSVTSQIVFLNPQIQSTSSSLLTSNRN